MTDDSRVKHRNISADTVISLSDSITSVSVLC